MRIESEQNIAWFDACFTRRRPGVDLRHYRIRIEKSVATLVEHRLIRNADAEPASRFFEQDRPWLLGDDTRWSHHQHTDPDREYHASTAQHFPSRQHHLRTPSTLPLQRPAESRHALPSLRDSTG